MFDNTYKQHKLRNHETYGQSWNMFYKHEIFDLHSSVHTGQLLVGSACVHTGQLLVQKLMYLN